MIALRFDWRRSGARWEADPGRISSRLRSGELRLSSETRQRISRRPSVGGAEGPRLPGNRLNSRLPGGLFGLLERGRFRDLGSLDLGGRGRLLFLHHEAPPLDTLRACVSAFLALEKERRFLASSLAALAPSLLPVRAMF